MVFVMWTLNLVDLKIYLKGQELDEKQQTKHQPVSSHHSLWIQWLVQGKYLRFYVQLHVTKNANNSNITKYQIIYIMQEDQVQAYWY